MDTIIPLYLIPQHYVGIALVSGKVAKFYRVATNETVLLKSVEVELPNRQSKGGQSSVRFERLTEEKRHNWVKKVAEFLVQYYVKDGQTNVLRLILAGPSEIKFKLRDQPTIQKYFSDKLQILDTSEIIDKTIHTVLHQAEIYLQDLHNPEELQAIAEVKEYLAQAEFIDRLVFGRDEVLTLLRGPGLKKLLLAQNIHDEEIDTFIPQHRKMEVIRISNITWTAQYGNIIGITWY